MKAEPRLEPGPGQGAEVLMLLQSSHEQHCSQERTPQAVWDRRRTFTKKGVENVSSYLGNK